eukprot:TRINITY_DN4534_c0_g1_i1.p1 TRINITY_DN4534_c0_g1~~TRINITY_DN4534_c0_g1_i1.p1  ORF type:complete len:222 (-),score=48.32 TRINITY_DN4534_c0_g1_i1:291-956(-)
MGYEAADVAERGDRTEDDFDDIPEDDECINDMMGYVADDDKFHSWLARDCSLDKPRVGNRLASVDSDYDCSGRRESFEDYEAVHVTPGRTFDCARCGQPFSKPLDLRKHRCDVTPNDADQAWEAMFQARQTPAGAQAVEALEELGFSRRDATAALEASNGDVEAATDQLLIKAARADVSIKAAPVAKPKTLEAIDAAPATIRAMEQLNQLLGGLKHESTPR